MVPCVYPLDIAGFGTDMVVSADCTSLRLRGELDLAARDHFRAALEEAEAAGAPTIVIDLRDLSFIDSSGMGALLRANDRARADAPRVVFVPATGPVARALALTGIDSQLPPAA